MHGADEAHGELISAKVTLASAYAIKAKFVQKL